MPRQARAVVLDRLRHTIDALEKRAPVPQASSARQARRAAQDSLFAHLPEDGLHEIWMPGFRDAGAGFAFALGHAAARLSQARPAIFGIQRAHEAQETGTPYAPGLAAFGLAPRDLVLVRTRTVTELLWAAEEAASCIAVAAVILDVLVTPQALDFTASRRLALRAATSTVPILALRYGPDREASAARTRWRIAPAASGIPAHDADAPGLPRWQATLEKAASGRSGTWRLAWTGTRFTALPDPQSPPHSLHGTPATDPAAHPAAPQASGAHLPALAHRLPATG